MQTNKHDVVSPSFSPNFKYLFLFMIYSSLPILLAAVGSYCRLGALLIRVWKDRWKQANNKKKEEAAEEKTQQKRASSVERECALKHLVNRYLGRNYYTVYQILHTIL
jgi:hypothetical protein